MTKNFRLKSFLLTTLLGWVSSNAVAQDGNSANSSAPPLPVPTSLSNVEAEGTPLITLDGQPLETTHGSLLFTENNEPIQVLPIHFQQTAPTANSRPIQKNASGLKLDEMIRSPIDHYKAMNNLGTNNFFLSGVDIPNQVRSAPLNELGSFEWTPFGYCWCTPSFCHKPLYFEQPNLERYGISPGPILAPVHSSAHFFGSIVMLPAKVVYRPWWTKSCTLGNNRPGDCVPMQAIPANSEVPGRVSRHLSSN